jgi:hypothetical protein
MKVYIAKSSGYYDDPVYISGVFSTNDKAQDHIEKEAACSRANNADEFFWVDVYEVDNCL